MVNIRLAHQHVTDTEKRLAAQHALIRRMTARGEDVTRANELLHTFEQILHTMREHLAVDEAMIRNSRDSPPSDITEVA